MFDRCSLPVNYLEANIKLQAMLNDLRANQDDKQFLSRLKDFVKHKEGRAKTTNINWRRGGDIRHKPKEPAAVREMDFLFQLSFYTHREERCEKVDDDLIIFLSKHTLVTCVVMGPSGNQISFRFVLEDKFSGFHDSQQSYMSLSYTLMSHISVQNQISDRRSNASSQHINDVLLLEGSYTSTYGWAAKFVIGLIDERDGGEFQSGREIATAQDGIVGFDAHLSGIMRHLGLEHLTHLHMWDFLKVVLDIKNCSHRCEPLQEMISQLNKVVKAIPTP